MSDQNSVSDLSTAGGDTQKRGRGPGKPKRARRNYAREFETLEYRAIAARDILQEIVSSIGGPENPATPLIRAAIRLLPAVEE